MEYKLYSSNHIHKSIVHVRVYTCIGEEKTELQKKVAWLLPPTFIVS